MRARVHWRAVYHRVHSELCDLELATGPTAEGCPAQHTWVSLRRAMKENLTPGRVRVGVRVGGTWLDLSLKLENSTGSTPLRRHLTESCVVAGLCRRRGGAT